MRRALFVPLIVIVSIVGIACSGSDSPEQGGFGVYEYKADGATITIEIPADSTQPLVVETESYRAATGSGPATYAIVNIDNSSGDTEVSVFQFSVVTDEGQTFEFNSASDLVNEWRPLASSDTRDLYNRGIRLSNEMLNLDRALPGARSTALFATSGQVPSLKTLTVQRNLIDFLGSIGEGGATPEPIRPEKIRSHSEPASTSGSESPATAVVPTATTVPPPTATAAPAPTSREFLDEKIVFLMERFDYVFQDPSAGRFSDEIHFEFTVGNDIGREIRALTGDVVFSDLFDREFERLGITISDPIPLGARIRFSDFFFEINQFIDSHQRLFNTDLEDLIVTFEVEAVILDDGTRIDATDLAGFATPVPIPTPTSTPTPVPTVTPTFTPTPTPTATPTVTPTPTPSPTPIPFDDLVATARESVVRVVSSNGTGSGFVVSNSPDENATFIVTAEHLVADSSDITVTFPDGVEQAAVRWSRAIGRDLLMLKTDLKDTEPLEFGPASDPRLGSSVLQIGFNTAGELTAETGVVNGTAVDGRFGLVHWRTSVPIEPGTIGGPVVNDAGKVIGIIGGDLLDAASNIHGFSVGTQWYLAEAERLLDGTSICQPRSYVTESLLTAEFRHSEFIYFIGTVGWEFDQRDGGTIFGDIAPFGLNRVLGNEVPASLVIFDPVPAGDYVASREFLAGFLTDFGAPDITEEQLRNITPVCINRRAASEVTFTINWTQNGNPVDLRTERWIAILANDQAYVIRATAQASRFDSVKERFDTMLYTFKP